MEVQAPVCGCSAGQASRGFVCVQETFVHQFRVNCIQVVPGLVSTNLQVICILRGCGAILVRCCCLMDWVSEPCLLCTACMCK